MQPNTGIEPVTYRLDSFAVSIPKLVRGKGVEPLTKRWQRLILPLN
jgi:hypothetical protein